MWYQAKISYQKENEKGIAIKITEIYLVEAISFTDAEARVYEIVGKNNPDFKIVALPKVKIHEVFFVEDGSETWYKVKVNFISYDEKAQKEKLTPYNMLIQADSVVDAYRSIKDKLGTLEDFTITDINITNILEVVPSE